jgi:hypothetical protein
MGGSAQYHTLIQQHIVADLRGLPDYHAHSMVDKKPPADGGSGVNLDPGPEAT